MSQLFKILIALGLLALFVFVSYKGCDDKGAPVHADSVYVKLENKIDSLLKSSDEHTKLQEEFKKQLQASKIGDSKVIKYYNTYYETLKTANDSFLLVAIDSLLAEHARTPVARNN